MDSFQRCVITLINNAISLEKISLDDDIQWDRVCLLAKKHKISSLILLSINKLNLSVPTEIVDALEKDAFRHAMLYEQQMYELARIEGAFKELDIDYMLLKGLNIRKLYPIGVTRTMKDLDILIKTEQYHQIKTVMQSLGFTETKETYHELIWRKGNVVVELHKCIESPYNKDYYSYYKDGWNFANRIGNSSAHSMSKEDEFVFIFTHFAGHYRNSGIGILHLIDLWLYLTNNPDMNQSSLRDAFTKLGLFEFYQNVLKTLKVWFGSAHEDKITELITANIFTKGKNKRFSVYQISGVARECRLSGKKESSKLKVFIKILFPNVERIRYKYPVLNKTPFLLPFVWIIRWFDVILFGRSKIKSVNKRMKVANQNNINSYLDELQLVGLDFKE